MLPGVHRVRARAKGGLAEYWYAWRGGPRILKAIAASEAALAREVARLTPAAADQYRALVHPAPPTAVLDGIITTYLTGENKALPPHLAKLAPRTLADLRTSLDVIRRDLGGLETVALGAKGARKALLAWRDRYAAHPRTADAHMGALSRMLTWAIDRDLVPANPVKEWPRLYSVNRAEAIWTKPDLVKLLKGAPKAFREAILLAVMTGLRGGDLIRLQWQHVGKDAITFPTGKSRGRRVVVIPITPRLRGLLRVIGPREVGTVLTSGARRPWTLDGLKTAMQREKTAKGIEGLRFHDLRGTAATYFIRAGLPVVDVALIMGWDRERTATLGSYVTAEAVAAGMLARLAQNKAGAGL